METILQNYNIVANRPGDIVEHIPTLYNYTKQCESVVELGVSVCISTWAFVKGLVENGKNKKSLLCCDIKYHPNVELVRNTCKVVGINYDFVKKNDLELDITEEVDLTFIDTWHIYGQLKRELAKFAPITRKYIIMHDTEIDAENGESIRDRHNIPLQSKETGIPEDEIRKGLRYAIEEFLKEHNEWTVDLVCKNNNGLTVLRRISQ